LFHGVLAFLKLFGGKRLAEIGTWPTTPPNRFNYTKNKVKKTSNGFIQRLILLHRRSRRRLAANSRWPCALTKLFAIGDDAGTPRRIARQGRPAEMTTLAQTELAARPGTGPPGWA